MTYRSVDLAPRIIQKIAQHSPPPCKSTKKPTPYQIKTTTLLLDLGEPSRSPQLRGRRWSRGRRAEPEAAGRGGGAAASGGRAGQFPAGQRRGQSPGAEPGGSRTSASPLLRPLGLARVGLTPPAWRESVSGKGCVYPCL